MEVLKPGRRRHEREEDSLQTSCGAHLSVKRK